MLWVLPRHFRLRHEAELMSAVAGALAESAPGAGRVWRRLLKEVVDLVVVSMRVRLEGGWPAVPAARREREGVFGLLRGLRLSVRTLARRPMFALAATLTLAAGVGCAAAAFGILDTLILQPLAHRDAAQLIMVWRDLPRMDMPRAPLSYSTLEELRAGSGGVLAGLEAYAGGAAALLQEGVEPEQVSGARVTGGLFRLLGNEAQLGRTIEPADDEPGAAPVVVLSHGLWLRYYGGSPLAIGKTIEVRETRHRIVGVMGAEFVFPSARAELWIPLRLSQVQRGSDVNYLTAVGRLRPGVTLERAQAQFDGLHTRLLQSKPDEFENTRLQLETRHEFVVRDTRRLVWLGMAAATLLLVIACANLSNLMLVRGLARGHELAVRRALGASRLRVAGQLMGESAVIGAAGAVLGVGLAQALTRMVFVLAPETLPRRLELGLDVRLIAFAVVTALSCALLCALFPVLRPTDGHRGVLTTAGGSITQSARLLQTGFMVAQVSLALVLLVVAGLLTGTLTRLLAVPVGFEGGQVLTAHLSLPQARYPSDERIGLFYSQIMQRLAAQPGVERVGGTWALPFSPAYAGARFLPEGSTEREGLIVSASPIRGEYLAAVGMRILRGRSFDERDHATSIPVGIINETLARRFWPGQDPIGKRMVDPEDTGDALTVIGVVNDVRSRDLAEPVQPEVYLPHAQATWDGSLYLTMRTSADPLSSSGAVRKEIRSLDPLLPVGRMTTMDALVSQSVATERFRARVLAALSAAAAFLALLGIYSVQSVFVDSRGRDLAVRLALGARPRRVSAEVVGRGMRITLLGLTLGLLLAVTAARGLQAQFFGLSPLDPGTYATAVVLFLSAAALACWLPARRIARIDPMRTLRQE
jgi:putative ABC transport system permease protein